MYQQRLAKVLYSSLVMTGLLVPTARGELLQVTIGSNRS
jgi:hypothetical protein